MVEAHNAKVKGNWTTRDLPQTNGCGKKTSTPIDSKCRNSNGGVKTPESGFSVRSTTDIERLNKTEKAFLLHLTHVIKPEWHSVQSTTLKLAFDTRLTPDFHYVKDGLHYLIDVKGWQREDALIKMKVAARLNTWGNFQIVSREKGGGWKIREINP